MKGVMIRLDNLLFAVILCCNIYSSRGVDSNFNNMLNISISNLNVPTKEERMDSFWTEKNIGYLTGEQKGIFEGYQKKIQEGKLLTGEERIVLMEFKESVIEEKLGEAKFKEYLKLLEKRDDKEKEMTLEERGRLYEIDKEIRN